MNAMKRLFPAILCLCCLGGVCLAVFPGRIPENSIELVRTDGIIKPGDSGWIQEGKPEETVLFQETGRRRTNDQSQGVKRKVGSSESETLSHHNNDPRYYVNALGKNDEVNKWQSLRGKLNDLHVDENNVLMFSSNEPFNQSHRHHAHTMAIHPFGTLNIDGSDKDRQVIAATLEKMDQLGTQAWTGYSFSWFASILARANMPELAYQYLTYYERAFILRNGFHVATAPALFSGFPAPGWLWRQRPHETFRLLEPGRDRARWIQEFRCPRLTISH